jgi:aminoglycoside phosphotransferase (APT) family kinase protein
MCNFNPDLQRADCERYVSQSLGETTHLRGAAPLTKSTREAPWRLDVEVGGGDRSYVLRLGGRNVEHEFRVLEVMMGVRIPSPRVYGWDPEGSSLGAPCFLSDYIEGESLLGPLLKHERWAEDLYIDTAVTLQSISRDELGPDKALFEEDESASHFLETANAYFQETDTQLAHQVYEQLKRTQPPAPRSRFSNGDLYPDNLLVRDRELVGVIDWEGAGFSDPIYEFLLTFFVCPSLRGRGIEERYCRMMNFDPGHLLWYRGLELFDTWHWVVKKGKPFVHYTDEVLREALVSWLGSVESR